VVFSHFKFFQANFRGEKGGNFVVGPGRHLASLRHWFEENFIEGKLTG